MNGVFASLGGVLLFLIPGVGVSQLAPGLRAKRWPARLGYAYLLGLAVVAGSLYAASHLLGAPIRRPAILVAAVLPVVAGVLHRFVPRNEGRHKAGPYADGGPRRGNPRGCPLAGLAAVALLSFVCLGLFVDAVSRPATGWDERMIWSLRARDVRAAGTVDLDVLRDGRWYVNHPRYPLLLPVAQAAVLELTAADEDRQPFRALYAALFPALLLVVWDAASRWAGRAPACCVLLAAAGAPALTFWQDGGAASAYSDLPLGCFAGAGLLLLLSARRHLADALAAGILLAGAALSKNEGALLALWAPCAVAPVLLRRRDLRRQTARLLAAAAPVVAALVFLASWRAAIPNRYDEDYAALLRQQALWPAAVTRASALLPLALEKMLAWDPWAAFWWIALLALTAGVRGLRGRRRPLAMTAVFAAGLPLAIGWGAYSINWRPAPLLQVTWTRFLIQGLLPFLLLLALAVRDVWRRSGAGAQLA